ncbi:MAG: hypothetical protein V4850_34355 [Myxococcota bacterium]
MLVRTIPAALVLAGCCPTFAQMDVIDHADAPADLLAEVRRSIDTFAAWTGRDGVCVASVEVVDVVDDEGNGGDYRGRGAPIRMRADMDVDHVIQHELCHALDFEERLAPPHYDLLEAAAGEDGADLDEEFAKVCDGGPPPLGEIALLEACGIESPLAAVLRDEVYRAYVDAPVTIAGPPALREVARPFGENAVVELGPWLDELLFVVQTPDGADELVRFDPIDATVRARIPLPAAAAGSPWHIPSDDVPRFGTGRQTWAVTADRTAIVAAPLPGYATLDHATSPIVAGGRVHYTDSDRTALRVASLEDGAELPGPGGFIPSFEPAFTWAVAANADGLVIAGQVDSRRGGTLATWSPTENTWSGRDLADGLDGDRGALLSGGRVARLELVEFSPWPRELEIPLTMAAASIAVLVVHGPDGHATVYTSCPDAGPILSSIHGAGGRLWTWHSGAIYEVVLP